MLMALIMVIGVLPVGVLADELALPEAEVQQQAESAVIDEIPVDSGEESADLLEEEATDIPADEDQSADDADLWDLFGGGFFGDNAVTETVNAATTYENNGTTYVLAGSDFQPTDGKAATGVTLLNNILTQVQSKYAHMDGFLFMGDYDYNYNASAAGKAALQSAVQAVYGTGMHEVYVEGNHDSDQGLVANGTLSPRGANDSEDFGVYVIHESDYMWYNSDKDTIQQTAEDLEEYLDDKLAKEYDAPIFVVSHLPLHYSMRTKNDGDGMYANYIFDVLNEAGEKGLNIIFLFGHNHSNGWDDYLGGAAVYLAKGDSINIAQASKTSFKAETLNFTYMNAGYVAYYRNVNTGSETDLTMTVFAITDDAVTV